MALGRLVYAAIRIDFRGTELGDVTVNRCFFSSFYSAQVCQVISSLDAGLLAGLTGGAQLTFSERITEGADRCRACLAAGARAA